MENRIAYFRAQAGMTQKELAILCGWGRASSRIGNYEIGQRNPSLKDSRIIAAALKKALKENDVELYCDVDAVFPPPPVNSLSVAHGS